MQCTGEVLSPLEVEILMEMDDAFRKQLAKTRDHQRSYNKPNQGQGGMGKSAKGKSLSKG